MSTSTKIRQVLAETLVISVRKSFWASPECEIFPNRIYTRRLMPGPGRWGSHSRNPLNNLTAILAGLAFARRHHPRLVVIGSASRATSWFVRFKRAGLLPATRLLVTTQSYFDDRQAREIDRIIIFSNSELELHSTDLQSKFIFMPLPADGRFDRLAPSHGDFIFSGGGAGRDFTILIEAMRGLPIRLELVTFSPRSLGWNGPLPGNVAVHWKMPVHDFLSRMAASRFVAAPLREGRRSHGQTTIVQAIRLGKALVSTRRASVDDYVAHEQNGLLVEPRDVPGMRAAVLRLWQDPILLDRCEQDAHRRADQLTYAAFAARLAELCQEMIAKDS